MSGILHASTGTRLSAGLGAAAAPDAWVEKLAFVTIVLAVGYVVTGIAGMGPSGAAAQTDYVNPINSWVWIGLVAMATPVMLRRWRLALDLARSNWPLLALFLYFALSATWALDPGTSIRRTVYAVIQLTLIVTLLAGIRRAPILHMAIVAICVTVTLADAAALVLTPGTAFMDDGFAGLQSQKNQTGLLLMYGLLAAGPGLFLARARLWRAGIGAAMVLMAALLVLTRSTTSQSVVISAAFVMPVLVLIAKLPRRRILGIAAAAVLLVAGCAFAYLVWCAITGTALLYPLRNATFTGRTDIWAFTVREIGKRPFFGAGFQSFWSIDPSVQPSLKTDAWFGSDTIINESHNGYLELMATCGIVGLLGALFVLFRAIVIAGSAMHRALPTAEAMRQGEMARPTAVFYMAFLLGLLVHNLTESNLFSNDGGLLAFAFLLCVMDLEKWRLTHRRGARR
jgi:O-antigen ligase